MIKKQVVLAPFLLLDCWSLQAMDMNDLLHAQLNTAIRKQNIQEAYEIIQTGFDVNHEYLDPSLPKDKQEAARIPLLWAAQNHEEKILQILIKAGANLYCTDANGNGALMLAVQSKSCNCVGEFVIAITRLTPDEKNSIKNWLLVDHRLRAEYRGLPIDLKRPICDLIFKSLVHDIQKRLFRADALEAFLFAKTHTKLDPRMPTFKYGYCYLEIALNREKLENDVWSQICREDKRQ